MKRDLISSLRKLSKMLTDLPWMVTGSANLYYRGLAKAFEDIDILIDHRRKPDVMRRIKEFHPQILRAKSGDELAKFVTGGIVVEIVFDTLGALEAETIDAMNLQTLESMEEMYNKHNRKDKVELVLQARGEQ